MIATLTLQAIDSALEEAQEREHRKHLGASKVADACKRKIWYGFRWAEKELFEGRMLRLFDRGHKEEERFKSWLEISGATVVTHDPATGEQYRISDCSGHFGGSRDAAVIGCRDVPAAWGWGLGEFKTHNDASFKALTKHGLLQSKPEHYGQMQAYQFKSGFHWGIYMAVNKNDDDLHAEIIQTNPPYASKLIRKANDIIFSDSPPPRIDNKPSYYLCKFCIFSDICHFGKEPERNCRNCEFSRPVDGGRWYCSNYNTVLSEAIQRKGSRCPSYRLKANFK